MFLGNRLDFLSHTLKFANDAYNFSREVRRLTIGIRNRLFIRRLSPQRNSKTQKIKTRSISYLVTTENQQMGFIFRYFQVKFVESFL